MIPVIPVAIGVVSFTVAAWVVNKGVTAITGRNLDENLDYGYSKVLAFVRPVAAPAETDETETP